MLRLFALAAVLVATLLVGAAAHADLVLTPAEAEAMASLDKGKYVRAREQAEKLLEKERTVPATFVLASVFYQAEGNLPRALFLLRRALRDLVKRFGEPPTEPEAIRWHKRLLDSEADVLGEMDDREGQLKVYDRYDAHYGPSNNETSRIWPLMKLGRFDEARAIGRKHITSDDLHVRMKAYNGLMAIEDEARNRKGAYEWGTQAMANTQEKSCVIAANTARAALLRFRFGEAEALVKKALKAEVEDCPETPWVGLVPMYLVMGEFQKSVSAFREVRKAGMSATERVQWEMSIQGHLGALLYALGQTEAAEARVRQVVDFQDRMGMTSASLENQRLTDTLLWWTIRRARVEQERERAAARPLWDALKGMARATAMDIGGWEKRRMAIKLAAHPGLLVDVVRPYWTDVAPWMTGTLLDVLGPGAVKKAIDAARARDEDTPEAAGYFDAFEAEAAWRDGDLAEAERLARSALSRLGPEPVLVRRRVEAVLADTLLRRGDTAGAKTHFHAVVQSWPTALTILRIALPASVKDDGSTAAHAVAEKLRASSRLRSGDLGFVVRVTARKDGLEMCLAGDSGRQYHCIGSETQADLDATVLAAVDAFHDKALAPLFDLTQSDLNSLDGRTGRLDADKAIQDILGKEATP